MMAVQDVLVTKFHNQSLAYLGWQFYHKKITASQFVTALYHAVLGREPDAVGMAYWVGRANTAVATLDSLVKMMNTFTTGGPELLSAVGNVTFNAKHEV